MKVPNLIKRCVIAIICLLLTSAQAQIVQGRWEVTKVNFEKNTDGEIETATYNSAAEVKDHIRFPQVLEVIDSKTILLQYADMEEKRTVEYKLSGDSLSIIDGALGYHYLYAASEGVITLTVQDIYVSKTRGGYAKRVAEKWIFTLKQQK